MASRQNPRQPSSLNQRSLAPDRPTMSAYSYLDPYPSRHVRTQSTSSSSGSGGVIPLPTKTYVRTENGALMSSNRDSTNYSNFAATSPRRASYVPPDARNPRNVSAVPQSSSTSGRHGSTAVIHNEPSTALVQQKPPPNSREGDFFVTSSNSDRSRPQIKSYRFDKNDKSHLVDSGIQDDRHGGSYDGQAGQPANTRRPDQGYHLRGAKADGPESDYEFIQPREMYTDTRPLWRPRRRSVGARPTSMYEVRPSVPANAPPVARRGLDRISEGIARSNSLREGGVSPSRYVPRSRGGSYSEDDNFDARRAPTTNQHAVYSAPSDQLSPLRSDFDARREPRQLRRMSRFEDSDLPSRGFGIRAGGMESPERRERSAESGTGYKLPLFGPPIGREGADPRRDTGRDAGPSDYEKPAGRDDTYRQRRTNESELPARENDGRYGRRRDEYEDDRRYGNEAKYENEAYARPNGDEASRRNRGEAIGVAAGAGAAALAADYARRQRNSSPTEKEAGIDRETKAIPRKVSPMEDQPRPRHYTPKEIEVDKDADGTVDSADADEEYRRRIQQIQQELVGGTPTKTGASQPAAKREERNDDTSDSEPPSPRSPPTNRKNDNSREIPAYAEQISSTSQALTPYEPPREDDDEELAGAAGALAIVKGNESSRVRIVEPPKDKSAPKGILRKPTEKFPEDPNPIREGVAQHPKMLKEGVPIHATWTKITREKVSPVALQEAGERFEVRQGVVIVLRALSQEEIQKFADRTRQIRGMDDVSHHHNHHHHHNRSGREEKRSHGSSSLHRSDSAPGSRSSGLLGLATSVLNQLTDPGAQDSRYRDPHENDYHDHGRSRRHANYDDDEDDYD